VRQAHAFRSQFVGAGLRARPWPGRRATGANDRRQEGQGQGRRRRTATPPWRGSAHGQALGRAFSLGLRLSDGRARRRIGRSERKMGNEAGVVRQPLAGGEGRLPARPADGREHRPVTDPQGEQGLATASGDAARPAPAATGFGPRIALVRGRLRVVPGAASVVRGILVGRTMWAAGRRRLVRGGCLGHGATAAARAVFAAFTGAQLVLAGSGRTAGSARGGGREREADGSNQVRNESEAGDKTASQGAPEGFPPRQTHGDPARGARVRFATIVGNAPAGSQ
jgi:hypothetical protein